jgi:SAM-dependent methyltransferase
MDGVPVLIHEANSVFSISEIIARHPDATGAPSAGWKRRLRSWLPGLSKNFVARRNYTRFAELLHEPADRAPVLILGAGNLGQGLDVLLAHPHIQLVESDVYFGPRTVLIADAHDIPFADATFAGVIIQAVLEHLVDPQRCVAEIQRVLRPAGLVYAETPFMQQVHEGRYDFTRYTHLGHRRLFRDFAEIASGPVAGPGMALAWAWAYFLMGFAGSRRARSAAYLLARLTGWPLKYFDYLLLRRPGAYDAGAGYYFMGRKGGVPLRDRTLILQYRGGM